MHFVFGLIVINMYRSGNFNNDDWLYDEVGLFSILHETLFLITSFFRLFLTFRNLRLKVRFISYIKKKQLIERKRRRIQTDVTQ